MHFSKPKPIYRQIADHILGLIITAKWKAGERIPSVRTYASEIEVNPNTVARTYNLLCDLGIIHTKRGVGYFLDLKALENAEKYMRSNFINKELPEILKTMELLNIKFSDINTNTNE